MRSHHGEVKHSGCIQSTPLANIFSPTRDSKRRSGTDLVVRLGLGLVGLEEGKELLRASRAGRLALCSGRRGSRECGLGGVPGGELAREVGGERGRLGSGREGVGLDDADVCVLGL